MAYKFTGFFSRSQQIKQSALMADHVFRELETPFVGCGILAPEMRPSFNEALQYMQTLGIASQDWMYMNYSTWAGPVEYVLAFGMRNGQAFGPLEGEDQDGEEAYENAMEVFGLADYAADFAPFERGFWEPFDSL